MTRAVAGCTILPPRPVDCRSVGRGFYYQFAVDPAVVAARAEILAFVFLDWPSEN